jgi:hypothetical protein
MEGLPYITSFKRRNGFVLLYMRLQPFTSYRLFFISYRKGWINSIIHHSWVHHRWMGANIYSAWLPPMRLIEFSTSFSFMLLSPDSLHLPYCIWSCVFIYSFTAPCRPPVIITVATVHYCTNSKHTARVRKSRHARHY